MILPRGIALSICAAVALLVGCVPSQDGRAPDVLVIGDSILAWHSGTGGSAPDALARIAERPVENRARSGSRVTTTSEVIKARGGEIVSQYTPGPYQWVIVNGGANDLLSNCGCRACRSILKGLIDERSQQGAIPDLVRRIRDDGARVLLLGYYRGPDRAPLFSGCRDELDVLNARLQALAAREQGVRYAAARDVIDPDNSAHFFVDRIHPSRLGAARIGQLLADAIAN